MKKPEFIYAKYISKEKPKNSEGVQVYPADEMDKWLEEKLDGVERIMKNHYWDSLELHRGIIEKHCEGIAQAIRQNFEDSK